MSALAHVAAVAWLTWPGAGSVAAIASPPSTNRSVEITVIAAAPTEDRFEVVLLPPEVVVALPAAATTETVAVATARPLSSRPVAGAEAAAAIVDRAQPGAAENIISVKPPGVGADPSGLRMRRAGPPRLLVTSLDKIADNGAVAAAPVPISGELEPAGRGRHRSDQGTFVARVARDGSVKLEDKPNLDVRLAIPSRRVLGNALGNWYRDPYAQTRDREREPVPSGAVDDEEEQRKRPKTVPVIKGSFDVSDWLMRMAGRDPYWAAKLSFLDRTRAERAEIATTYRAELLRNVVAITRSHLTRAWQQPTLAGRKRALFELWDECAESGDAELLQAAGLARAAVIGFIRGHLAPTSAEAYTDDELRTFNAVRQSRQRFAPYQDAGP